MSAVILAGALRESEERFQALFDRSLECIYLHDFQGRFVEANPAALDLLKYSAQEIRALKFTDLLSAEQLPLAMETLAELNRVGAQRDPTDFVLRARDGTLRHVQTRAVVLHRAGRPPLVLGVARDVTERIRAEEALRKKNLLLQALHTYSLEMASLPFSQDIFEFVARQLQEFSGAMAVGVSSYDQATRELVVRHTTLSEEQSSLLVRVLGRRFEGMRFKVTPEMYGRIVREVLTEVHSLSEATLGMLPDLLGRLIQRALGVGWFAGIGLQREGELLGTVMVAGRHGSKPPDLDELKAFAGVTANALRRWLVEHEALASEARLQLMASNIQDIIWQMDASLVFTYVSPTVTRLLGYRPEQVVGHSLQEFVTPRSAADLAAALARYSRQQERGTGSLSIELEQLHRDGRRVWTEAVATPVLTGQGLLSGFQGITRDITRRKQAEEERQRLQEQLQQAMKMEAVGRLAGGVAHDFNNLLTAIQGNLSLALLELNREDPLVELLQQALQASESAAGLTRQLLAFSRKQIIEPRVLDLHELLRNLRRMLVRLIGEDFELELLPERQQVLVKADPGQVEQILVNLVVNARDAMPGGGKISLATSSLQLDEEQARSKEVAAGPFVRLSVRDTGQGMSEEVKSRLFEPFFTTKPKGRGTGLGLATSYGAVRQMGGFIEVESSLGQGTTFFIHLPAAPAESRRQREESPALQLSGGRETVLLVEDEPAVRQLMVRLLGRLGYRVLQARDGQEALQVSRTAPEGIQLLLTDVVMPGMNGRELAQQLRASLPGLAVLFVSGYPEEVIAHHGVVEEGVSFLAKPYSPQALAEKIRQVLGSGPDRS